MPHVALDGFAVTPQLTSAAASRRVGCLMSFVHRPVVHQSGHAPPHQSVGVRVGSVMVGGGAPIVVQSMTNPDTADVDGTVAQVAALARAGSEIVRITVDRDEAAAAVPRIRERLDRVNVPVPLVGDFHYI